MNYVLDHPEARRLYEEELLIGEATENVAALLKSLRVSQRELARRLSLTESRVSQIVSGADNLTLKSLAAIGWALGVRFELEPSALAAAERIGTPAENDPQPPDWLKRLKIGAAVGHQEVPSPRERADVDWWQSMAAQRVVPRKESTVRALELAA